MKDFSKIKHSSAKLHPNEIILGHSTSKKKQEKDLEEGKKITKKVKKKIAKQKRK